LKSKGRQDCKTVEARGFLNGQVKKEIEAGDEPQLALELGAQQQHAPVDQRLAVFHTNFNPLDIC
jgi:hypothetical protein